MSSIASTSYSVGSNDDNNLVSEEEECESLKQHPGAVAAAVDHDDDDKNDDDSGYDHDGGGDVIPEDENDNDHTTNNDFFADSPYFDAFIDKEIAGLELILETMKDVASKTKEFAQLGSQMAVSAGRLARSCRLLDNSSIIKNHSGSNSLSKEDRRKILGPQTVDTFDEIGDVLDEMASAQEHMCRFFKAYLVPRLENLAQQKVKEFRLREEATKESKEAEQFFYKYLNEGKNPWGEKNNGEGSGHSPSSRNNHHNSHQNSSRMKQQQTILIMSENNYDHNSSHNNSNDHPFLLKEAVKVARWKHDLIKIRVHHISAELKRYQLSKHIVDSKFEIHYELSSTAGHIIGEMDAYHTLCSNIVGRLAPKVRTLEQDSKESQANHQTTNAPIWAQREKVLSNILTLTKQSEMDAHDEEKLISRTTNPYHLDTVCFKYDIGEENTQLWDLPGMLASFSGHRRPIPSGVIAEGWLYERTSTLFSMPSSYSWNRRCWFMVRNDGIFCLQPNNNNIINNNNHINKNHHKTESNHLTTQRKNHVVKVKICDLRLCHVREYRGEIDNDDPTARFCFELIVPGKHLRPRIFQARGPQELQMWLSTIRLAISTQLAAGEDNTITMRKLSKMNMKNWFGGGGGAEQQQGGRMGLLSRHNTRESSSSEDEECAEIRVTVMERGPSVFNLNDLDLDNKHSNNNHNNDKNNGGNDVDDEDDLNEVVKEIMDANPTCADCGADSPNWASLNLGVIICLECSGVHRSMGVHISKVRSLTLDSLSDREVRLLLSLGNIRMNQFWEKETPENIEPGIRKNKRKEWIYRKYVKKEFIGSSPFVDGGIMGDNSSISSNENDDDNDDEHISSLRLYEASKRGDVIGVAQTLIHGGKVNWRNPNEYNKSALHVCGQNEEEENDSEMISECMELLLQNGAQLEFLENYTPSTAN